MWPPELPATPSRERWERLTSNPNVWADPSPPPAQSIGGGNGAHLNSFPLRGLGANQAELCVRGGKSTERSEPA